jgi:hypothetical protein
MLAYEIKKTPKTGGMDQSFLFDTDKISADMLVVKGSDCISNSKGFGSN